MTIPNPQDETWTTDAPHSTPDNPPGPNSPETNLGIDDSGDLRAPESLKSPNLAEERSIPGCSGKHRTPHHSEEHSSSHHSEEHQELDLSKQLEGLICDFEECQKKQLQILRDITNNITNNSKSPSPGPVLPTNPRPTIEISSETRERILSWDIRRRLQRKYAEIPDALLLGIENDSQKNDLIAAIQICIMKIPYGPNIPPAFILRRFLDVVLYERSSIFGIDSHESISNTWKTIDYQLDNSSCATPQNDSNADSSSRQNKLVYGRVIHYFIEYRCLSIRRLCEIFQLFVNFPAKHKELAQQHKVRADLYEQLAEHEEEQSEQQEEILERVVEQEELVRQEELAQQQDEGELLSHILKVVLGYAMEWKVFRWSNNCAGGFYTLWFNFRFFEIPLNHQKSDIETTKRQPGRLPQFELFREIGRIPLPVRTGHVIVERRSLVFMVYGTLMDTPCWTIFNFSGQNLPRSDDGGAEDTGLNFFDDVSHFRTWYNLLEMELQNCLFAWQTLISEMDVGIGLKINELGDSRTLGKVLFDENQSNRLNFYSASFFMLRRFADCIEETIKDLEHCCQEVDGRLEYDGTSAEGKKKIQKISKQFLRTHRGHFQDLLQQIQKKIDVIKPLQESLFSSTAIREASEATHHGRYIFVFTMMTIVYLPLSFVTSLFGMNNITENSPLATSMAPFAVTFSVVAAVTYIIASGSFPFANRTKFRPMLAPIWNLFRLLLKTGKNRMMMKMKRERIRDPELESVSLNYNLDPLNSSSKSRALKRIFSFFQLRRSQPAEESSDVAIEGMRLSNTGSNREEIMRSTSFPN